MLGRLDRLRLIRCPHLADLSHVAGTPISHLALGYCPVTDLAPLQAMPSLRELWFVDERPIDLSPLASIATPLTIRVTAAQAERMPPLGPNVTVKTFR